MKTNNKNLKTLVFSLGLAAMTLTAGNLNAQNRPGGLFGESHPSESTHGALDRGTDQSITDGGITNADFGEEAPLGSGLAILIGAGLGYVALKKKEDEQ